MMTSVLSFSTPLTPAFASSENEITAGSEPAIVLESQEELKAEEAQEAVAEPYQKEPSETVAEPNSEEIPVAEESLKNDEDPESSEEDSLDAMVSSGREVTEEADKKEELEAESQDVALTGITEEFTLPATVREGYTFDHWKGSEYKAGESYKVKEDHTFTAQWKANAPDNGGSSRGSNSVNTGDQSGLMMWFGLMTGSLLAIFAVLFLRKREMK